MNRSVIRGIAIVVVAAVITVVLLLTPGTKKPHPPNYDPWVLVSYDPDNKYGTYLGNGLISTRIKGDGVGSQNGEPLPCFMAGLYDDEKLIPTPTWSDLRFYDGKQQFKIDKTAPYKQILNMKTGILTTEATWRAGGKILTGKIEVIVSRAEPNVALIRAEFVPDFEGTVTVVAPMSRCDKMGVAIVGWLSSTLRHIRSEGRQKGLSLTVSVRPEKTFKIDSYTSIAADAVPDRARKTAESKLRAAVADRGFVDRHIAAWAKLWKKDIIINGPRKDQQVIHSCMFYLLQSVREGSRWSIPPMGLSDNAFSGHVFWDADVWMFPALILQHPELARSIVDYRLNTLPGAMANAKASGYAGAEYAWESGRTGREDTPPGLVYRHERHINGDVALAQWQYYLATGNLDWLKTRGYPVLKATADYWVSRVKFIPEKDRCEIHQVVPPDESAGLVDNSAYTNAIAKMNLEFAVHAARLIGVAPNPKWAEIASKLYIPLDSKARRFIAFDNYKGYDAKQADTELLIYPLQFKIPGQDMAGIYKNTFSFYVPKVMPGGPAMSASAHSVIAARLGNCEKAYADFQRSYKPFLRGPFNYFNEKRSRVIDNMCFLTGAAGPIQAVLYGLVGVKMDYDSPSAGLLHSPCLPKQWKSIEITGVRWRGKTFDIRIGS